MVGAWRSVHAVFQKMLEKPSFTGGVEVAHVLSRKGQQSLAAGVQNFSGGLVELRRERDLRWFRRRLRRVWECS